MGLRNKAADAGPAAGDKVKTPAAETAKPAVTETVPTAGAGLVEDAEKGPAWTEQNDLPRAGADAGLAPDTDLQGDDHHHGEFDATAELANGKPAVREGLTIDNDTQTATPPAVQTQNTSLAASSAAPGGLLATQQELAAAGYVTDVGFGAFPNLVLNNLGEFEVKDWSANALDLKAIDVIVVQVRRKWLYREKKEKTKNIRYSYDDTPYPKNPQAADAGGTPISAFIDWMEGEGMKWESKLYYEALAIIVGGEGEAWKDHEGEMILVSMSPTSKTKWSGYTLQTRFIKKALPHQVVTRISRGPAMKVQDQSFYPLAFKAIRAANLAAFEAAEGFEVVGDVQD